MFSFVTLLLLCAATHATYSYYEVETCYHEIETCDANRRLLYNPHNVLDWAWCRIGTATLNDRVFNRYYEAHRAVYDDKLVRREYHLRENTLFFTRDPEKCTVNMELFADGGPNCGSEHKRVWMYSGSFAVIVEYDVWVGSNVARGGANNSAEYLEAAATHGMVIVHEICEREAWESGREWESMF